MRIIRFFLGALILFFDWLFTPRAVQRHTQQQEAINAEASKLALYQYKACPFCVKVRRAMKRQSLSIKTLDAKRCEKSRDELINGGGKLKVPCLKIEDSNGEVSWMYESSAIIDYLNSRFSQTAQ